MFLFIVLAVIQSSLIIPGILPVSRYIDEETTKEDGMRNTLMNFMIIMSILGGLSWFGSEIALSSVSHGVTIGLEWLSFTLPVNVIFVLSLLLAMFSEMRLRRRSE